MKFVDLFAGIGGFHQAARNVFGSKYRCVATCEINQHCKRVLTRQYDISSTDFHDDIKSINNPSIAASASLPSHDILFGGFPCQSFSNVGMRRGLNDDRGILFYDLARVIEHSTPSLFLLENVQKITTIENGKTLQKITSKLTDLGYNVSIWDLRSDMYGLPQKRRRIFIAGVRSNKKSCAIPPPPTVDLESSKYKSVWELLDQSMPERHIVPQGSRKTIFEKNPKWMGHLGINNSIARPLCASMGKWHRANQDNYFTEDYIYDQNRPNLIDYDWKKENLRRITPIEGLRLQGFGSDLHDTFLQENISITSQYHMLGNAVPVNLAEAALKQLISHV